MAGKVAAFAHYGVTLTNDRLSWSGLTPKGEVVVGLWQDEFDYKTNPVSYQPNPATNDLWRDKFGNRQRITHLIHARDTAGGRFRVVVMRAVDEAANPREVAEAFPRDNLVMQLVQLDEETGVFRARLVGEK
ncbi:hypothetical protein [Roseiarcus sp.]|uniref:hypothetical protein n=1 Tax=Roseiarcus sp. TaxID=1969460 RepID=UPI003F9A67A7